MKIAVLGAGAWGTALAAAAAAQAGRNDVLLWARSAAQADGIAATRHNALYLPAIVLPPALRLTADHTAALAHAAGGLLVIATPMSALRDMLSALPPPSSALSPLRLLWLCKGFEAGSGALAHEVAAATRPGIACGVLSGPSFAIEVARGQPTALVAASESPAITAAAVDAFHSETLRIYTSTDTIGVEVGGAVKNVLAIAAGILDGAVERNASGSSSSTGNGIGSGTDSGTDSGSATTTPGLNARAALITRGLAEMTRLGVALGARSETFMGLSGLGDLVLTTTGALSRNRQVGLLLAGGKPLAAILAELGHVAEGVHSAATVLGRARAVGVEMPICGSVADVIAGRTTAQQALARLMAREAKAEVQPPPA